MTQRTSLFLGTWTFLAGCWLFFSPSEAASLTSKHLTLSHDPASGTLTLAKLDKKTPALHFQLPEGTVAANTVDAFTFTLPDKHSLHFTLPADQPFALIRTTLANPTGTQTNTPTFRLPEATLNLGIPADWASAGFVTKEE